MKKKTKSVKKAVRKVAKKSVKKSAKTSIKNSTASPIIKLTKPPLRKKKMTIREYAEKEGMNLTRHFVGRNPNMSMQSYLKKIGLPNTAKVFRILNNEKA